VQISNLNSTLHQQTKNVPSGGIWPLKKQTPFWSQASAGTSEKVKLTTMTGGRPMLTYALAAFDFDELSKM